MRCSGNRSLLAAVVFAFAICSSPQGVSATGLGDDPRNLHFPQPALLKPSGAFWTQIYTAFGVDDFVLRDRERLDVIYGVVRVADTAAPARAAVGSSAIEDIMARYAGPRFGFASKNFYAEFLAALKVVQPLLAWQATQREVAARQRRIESTALSAPRPPVAEVPLLAPVAPDTPAEAGSPVEVSGQSVDQVGADQETDPEVAPASSDLPVEPTDTAPDASEAE